MDLCNICLRTKLNLRSFKDDDLEQFYDELCDFGGVAKSKFCSECQYKLKKFYEFKNNCRLAIETLKTWMKQSKAEKKPKDLLYTTMCTPHLSLCNKNNFRVYFYQTADIDMVAMQKPSSTHPHIVTVNIPRDNENPDSPELLENVNEQMIPINKNLNEQDIKLEFVNLNENETKLIEKLDDSAPVKSEHNLVPNNTFLDVEADRTDQTTDLGDEGPMEGTDDDSSDSEDDINLDNITNDDNITHEDNITTEDKKTKKKPNSDSDDALDSDDSDDSLKELKTILKSLEKQKQSKKDNSSTDINYSDIITKPKRKPFNIEDLKTKLKEKFKRCGTVKDEKGNVIDVDIVLNNLDKVPYLYPVKKLCLGPGPFSQLAIRKLAEIQSRYGDTMFETIRLTTQAEMKAEFEKQRQTLKYTKKPHRCESCLKSFLNNTVLDYHVQTRHDPGLPFECSICHMRFSTEMRREYHYYTHKTMLKCKLCDYATGTRTIMMTHVNKHKGITYNCEHCEHVFTSKSTLAQHINNVHASRHACALCAAAFMTALGLKVHSYKKHPGEVFVESEDNKKCEECNVLFISSEVYNQHVRKTHSAGTTRRYFGRGVSVFSCVVCEWKGPSRLLQTEHYQAQHPDADPAVLHKNYNYLCHDCGQRFKCVTAFSAHMNKHAGARPFACGACPAAFYSRHSLESHALRHAPPTKECRYCGKKFATNSGLSTHVRIHINDRRYKCNICGKGFLHNVALREHISSVHYNIRRKRKPRRQNMDVDSD